MKTGIIPSSKLDPAWPKGLNARSYLDPTREIDKEISSLKRRIERHQERLKQLEQERTLILEKS